MSNKGKWDLTTISYEQALTNEKVCDFTQCVALYCAILVLVGNQMVDVPFMQSTHEDPGVQIIFPQNFFVRMPRVQA
jgi:hypothetical protein